MSDRHVRLIVRHFHVERLSDSQNYFDPPRQRTTRNCRKQKFPAKRQTESIRYNWHWLRQAVPGVERSTGQQMFGIRQVVEYEDRTG
jgi:hypothetical protein